MNSSPLCKIRTPKAVGCKFARLLALGYIFDQRFLMHRWYYTYLGPIPGSAARWRLIAGFPVTLTPVPAQQSCDTQLGGTHHMEHPHSTTLFRSECNPEQMHAGASCQTFATQQWLGQPSQVQNRALVFQSPALPPAHTVPRDTSGAPHSPPAFPSAQDYQYKHVPPVEANTQKSWVTITVTA